MPALLIRPADYCVLVWLALALASTAWVAWDQFARNPEPTVMRRGSILVTLYGGPLALLVYAGRQGVGGLMMTIDVAPAAGR